MANVWSEERWPGTLPGKALTNVTSLPLAVSHGPTLPYAVPQGSDDSLCPSLSCAARDVPHCPTLSRAVPPTPRPASLVVSAWLQTADATPPEAGPAEAPLASPRCPRPTHAAAARGQGKTKPSLGLQTVETQREARRRLRVGQEPRPRPGGPHTSEEDSREGVLGAGQRLPGSGRGEEPRPRRPRNTARGRQRLLPHGAARRRRTPRERLRIPRERLRRDIAPLSGSRPGLAARGRWGGERRRHGPAHSLYSEAATAAECKWGTLVGAGGRRAARRLRGVRAPEPAALRQPGRTCAGGRRGAAAASLG